MATLIVLIVVAVVVLFTLARGIRIVPQARAGIVERLGRYYRTLDAGLALVVPYVDRVKPLIDLREQVVSFNPQPVITEDNLVIQIDTVLYFQVTDPKAATYEIANFIAGVEQLTVTTLRNVVGGMTLEDTLTSRDQVSAALRHVLDEATGKWGIRVNRVELKAVDPPASIQEAMEKQMRAERDRRAAILTAEGVKQSQILTAEGEKQSAILRAEGQREAQILQAEGQSKAIETVFDAIHRGDADPKLLAYQYLQVLPQIAQGESNKVWIIPSEVTQALQQPGCGDPEAGRAPAADRRYADPCDRDGGARSACLRGARGARLRELAQLAVPDFELDVTDRVLNPATYRGAEGLRQFFAEVDELWESMDMDVERLVERGEEVLALLLVNITGRGSGLQLENRIAQLWTARDGRLVRMRVLRRPGRRARRSSRRAARHASQGPLASAAVFDALSDRLQEALGDVRSRGKLTEDDVNKAMRQVRLALLEADVNFKVVKQFTDGGQGAGARAGRARLAQPGPAGRQDRLGRADRADGRRRPRPRARQAGPDGDPDGRPAGLGQDHRLRQARPPPARGARHGRGASPPATSTAPRPSTSSSRWAPRPARTSTSRARAATRSTSPSGRSTRPSRTVATR